jgi:hypothetical protein
VDRDPSFWTDPRAVAANEDGRLTPEQYELVAGSPPGSPYPVAALLVLFASVPVALLAGGQTGWGITTTTLLVWAAIWAGGMRLEARSARRRLLADLNAPTVESGVGEIRRSGKGSAVVVPGTRPQYRWDGPRLPEPGWYRLYWLRQRPGRRGYQANWLLSAAPATLSGWPPDRLAPERDRILAALRRTPDELADNEAGVLSDDQRREVRRAARRAVLGVLAGAPFGLAFLAMVPAILWGTVAEGAYAHAVLVLLPAGVVAMLAAWTVSRLQEARALRATLAAPAPVLRTEGPVSLLEDDGAFRVAAGERAFDIPVPVAGAFTVARPYALYHLDRPPRLLSAAPAGTGDRGGAPAEPVDS